VLAVEGVELPGLPDSTRLIIVPYELIRVVSQTRAPQGVAFICSIPEPDSKTDQNGRYLLIDRVQDPGNVGTMLRTAEALGASGAWLTEGCAGPFGHKAVQAGMGAVFRLPVRYVSAADAAEAGIPVYAAVAGGEDVRGIPRSHPCVLAIGNEGAGLSRELLSLVSRRVSIPMTGKAESLNAAAAAAILMWELF